MREEEGRRSLTLLTCREPIYRSDFRRQDAVQPHSLTARGAGPSPKNYIPVSYLNPPNGIQPVNGICFLEGQN